MKHPNEYPILKSARREALGAIAMLVIAAAYSITVCYQFGYGRDPKTLTYVLGFPDWIFWGIVFPWGCCTLLSTGFAFLFMKDEDLEPPTSTTT